MTGRVDMCHSEPVVVAQSSAADPQAAQAGSSNGGSSDVRVRAIGADEFERASAAFSDRDYQAAPAYLRTIAARRGERLDYLAVHDHSGGGPVGLVAARVRTLPVVGGGVAVIAGGPLVATATAPDAAARGRRLASVVDAAHKWFAPRGIRLHVRPPLLATLDGWDSPRDWQDPQPGSTVLEPYHTMVLDLGRTDEELRAALKSQWRRNLRDSEVAGLAVATVPVADGWSSMRPMFEVMKERKGFDVALDAAFWTEVLSHPDADSTFRAHLVSSDGETVAAVVTAGAGDVSTYLLGASSPAAHPTHAGYLAQFRAVLAARQAGHRYYDLGGVDRVANPGGWQFKSGMRGFEVTTPRPVVLAANGMRGLAARTAEALVARRRGGEAFTREVDR